LFSWFFKNRFGWKMLNGRVDYDRIGDWLGVKFAPGSLAQNQP
jgi:hypothetical protein